MAALGLLVVLTGLVGFGGDPAAALDPPSLPADSISYGYDELGRLAVVIDPSAPSDGVARYVYDEVGNITAIERLDSSGVSVVHLSPARGPVGSEVVIYGTGFSATPAENTVEFAEEAEATVTLATETQLHVTVPSGAATGEVSVTTPGGSAASDADFTVVAAPGEPSISGFSPTVAEPGTTITVSGGNFGPAVADNVVAIGQVRGKLATASASSLTFPVPAGATSGRVLVATPNGSTLSSDDLFVPPAGTTASQVMTTDRMTVGETNNVVSVTDSSKVALVVFDADAGQHVFVRVHSLSYASAVIELYDPFGIQLDFAGVISSGGYLDTQRLPTSGTYTILVDPVSGSGNATLSLYDATPASATIAADGQPVAITGLTVGQNVVRTFEGSEGQRVFIRAETQMTGVVRLRHPDGWVIGSASTSASLVGHIDTKTLDADGTYTIEVDPSGTGTGNVTLTLYSVPADDSGSITAGGSASTVTISTPGQNGVRTFSGTADQRISLDLTSISMGTGACRLRVFIYKPDTSTLASNTCINTSSAFIDVQTLPATGTYTILVDPIDARTGSVTLTLYDVPADDSGSITAGGSASTVTISTPGQNGARTFSGTTDQRVSLNLTSNSIGTGALCRVRVFIYKPDTSTLVSNTCINANSAFIDTQTLPATGTYTILIDPIDARTGSVTLTLYDVPADDGGAITIDGGSDTTTLSTPGQNGLRTFDGDSSGAITLTLTSVSIGSSGCCSARVSIKRPNGSNLVSPTLFGTSGKTVNTTLDATGTHTILVDPDGAATGSATVEVTSNGSFTGLAGGGGDEGTTASEDPPEPAIRDADPTAIGAGLTTGGEGGSQLLEYTPGTVEEWLPRTSEPSTWFSGRPESPYEPLPPLEARPGTTALSGQVLRLDGLPLAGVAVSAEGRWTETDESGRFLLTRLPAGRVVATVDASTADREDASYGIYEIGVNLEAGETTVLPYTIWSPKLDTANEVELDYPLEEDVVLTTPLIPGLEVTIPAGSEVHDRQGDLVRRLGITPVPLDRSPFPMPGQFPVYFTIQPGAAYVWPHGVEIVYPNKTHARPGERVEFFSYDPLEKDWYAYGKGTVTPNGRQIAFDRGTRQYELTSSGVCVGCILIAGLVGILLGFEFGGDPVDLATGNLVHPHSDLVERGVPQIDLTRVYNSGDTESRSFGVGARMSYEMALYQPDSHDFSSADLILADGRRIHYERVSPGAGYGDMVLQANSTPTRFLKSRISWNGRAFELRLTDGTVYTFGNGGLLESIRDRFGNQTTLVRSAGQLGNIIRIHSSSGRWLKLTYASNRVSQAEDQSGRTVSYAYDSGRLWKATNASGDVTEYGYDGAGRLETIEDPRDIVWLTNDYDANGRVETQTLADNSTYEFDYTLDGNGKVTETEMTDPRGHVRRVTFNSAGRPLTDTWALGTAVEQTATYEYQAVTNLLLAETDERGRRTEYAYNAAGSLTEITELAGTADEVTTTFDYETAFQQLTEARDPLGHGPDFAYDGRGALTEVTDARGKEWDVAANTAGQIISVTDPVENETTYSYVLGDLSTIVDPLETTASLFYDSAGRAVSYTDPLNMTAHFSYDPTDALVAVADPAGGETLLERDENGNLIKLTDARLNETAFEYDEMDRIESREDPLEETETFTYDENGNLIETTDREGQTTVFAYDELDRLAFAGFDMTESFGDPSYESTIDYDYDDGNRLREAVDSEYGMIVLDYDELDRLIGEETLEGAIAYTYDAAGRRETMTVDGEPEVEYGFDNADQLTGLTRDDVEVGLAYDDASRLESLTLPNGIVQLYDYDAASNLAGIGYELDSSPLGGLVYGHDRTGNPIAQGGSFARAGLPAAVASSDHDAANRVIDWNGDTLAYDGNGNLVDDDTRTYQWNARGELTAVSGGGTSASFAYDPFGRRTSFTLNAAITRYLHDGDNVVQELTALGVPTADLLAGLGPDELYAVTDGNETLSFLTDALGSTLALTDEEGDSDAAYTYEPFGKATVTGTGSTAYQYTRRPNDQTGLQYNRARYYNPSFGRFISEDPLDFAGGDINLYAYVGNAPFTFTDPRGMQYAPALPQAPSIPGPSFGDLDRALGKILRSPAGKAAGWAGIGLLGYEAGAAARKFSFSAAEADGPTIKSGSAGGPTAGRPFPKRVKDEVKDDDPSSTCVYCGRPGTGTEVDHAIPRSRGGNATKDNAQLTCPWCNRSKGPRKEPRNPPPGYPDDFPPRWWLRFP